MNMTVAPSGPTATTSAMHLVGNVLWLVLSGVWLFISYVGSGLLMCLTIIGIPFGVQSFKMAVFALWPFGKAVIPSGPPSAGKGCLNILWLLGAGLWLALGHIFFGLLLCITVIGIPFGLQNFKLAQLALWPFGTTVVPLSQVPYGVQPVVVVQQR